VISALLVLSVLLWLGPFFTLLPRCVLAAIIVVSLKGMFVQVKELGKLVPRLPSIDKSLL
jgi:solute carrier family 26 protein